MTLASSGSITTAQIASEIGASTVTIPTDVRTLTGISSGAIVIPTDFYSTVGLTDLGSEANTYPATNTNQITIPAAASVGDIAVLFDMAFQTSGSPTSVTPTGWTKLAETAAGNLRGIASYRQLTSGQPGSTITGMNGSERDRKIMCVIHPKYTVNTITPGGWLVRVSTGDPTAISVTSGSASTNLVVFGFAVGQNTVSLSFSPSATSTKTSGDALKAGYKLYTGPDTTANVTVDTGSAGDSVGLAAGYLRLMA